MNQNRDSSRRDAFAAEVPRPVKRTSGRTPADRTPLAIRTTGVQVDPALRDYVFQRVGAKLSKFASHIERITVRFEDVNGPRGGVDIACRLKVVLSGLDSVVFEQSATGAREAIDLAGAGVERAVRRALGRVRPYGRTPSGATRKDAARPSAGKEMPGPEVGRHRKRRPLPLPQDGSLICRRVGHAEANLDRAAARPEKQRRDTPVDTALPGWSATDRRAGGSSTAARNTKRNTARASAALEDSAQDRPSRKSTRKSANRSKRDSNLRRRQMRAASSPKARADRASAR